MRECSARLRHAATNAFSVVGRIATISYADATAERRWLREGSERVRVQRRRITVLGGTVKGNVVGIAFVIVEGSGPLWM